MRHYYLVPVTARLIQINGISLFTMLKHMDSELYQRELDRIHISYEMRDNNSQMIREYNEETKRMYQDNDVLEYLAIEKDETGVHEVGTKLEVEGNSSYLEVFEVPSSRIGEYLLENPDYCKFIRTFILQGISSEKDQKKVMEKNQK